jgi:hypothetical protein
MSRTSSLHRVGTPYVDSEGACQDGFLVLTSRSTFPFLSRPWANLRVTVVVPLSGSNVLPSLSTATLFFDANPVPFAFVFEVSVARDLALSSRRLSELFWSLYDH